MTGQMTIFDYMAEETEQETEPIRPVVSDPGDFEQYIGKCEFCMWYGYGLRNEKPTDGHHCQWEEPHRHAPFVCKNRSKWKPGDYYIPGLCSNCTYSNCFHYQEKEEYKGKRGVMAFRDPVEEPNIYCTRDEGSLNRREVYRDFWEHGFGACKWDRQHEWDTCDGWRSDGWKLRRDK